MRATVKAPATLSARHNAPQGHPGGPDASCGRIKPLEWLPGVGIQPTQRGEGPAGAPGGQKLHSSGWRLTLWLATHSCSPGASIHIPRAHARHVRGASVAFSHSSVCLRPFRSAVRAFESAPSEQRGPVWSTQAVITTSTLCRPNQKASGAEHCQLESSAAV